MKHLASLLLVGALAAPALLAGGGCAPGADADPATVDAADRRATLTIEGMTCASCAAAVEIAAKRVDGVATIEVDAATGEAVVTFDSSRASAAQVAAAVTEAGYETAVETDEGR